MLIRQLLKKGATLFRHDWRATAFRIAPITRGGRILRGWTKIKDWNLSVCSEGGNPPFRPGILEIYFIQIHAPSPYSLEGHRGQRTQLGKHGLHSRPLRLNLTRQRRCHLDEIRLAL